MAKNQTARAWFDELLSIPRLVQWQGVIADVAKQMAFAMRVLNNGMHWEFIKPTDRAWFLGHGHCSV